MKSQSLGTILLLLAEVAVGTWAVWTMLEPDHVLGLLLQFSLCG